MQEITYHKATVADIDVLADFRIEFMLSLQGPQPAAAIAALKQSLLAFFTEAIGAGTYVCYIAREGAVIAGIGGMSVRRHPGNFKNPSGKMGYLMNMYTLPAYRRRGICAAIVDLLVADGITAGIATFELHATKAGEKVYPRHGFELHNEPTYRRYVGLEQQPA